MPRPHLGLVLLALAPAILADEPEPPVDAYFRMPLCIRIADRVRIDVSVYVRSEGRAFAFRGQLSDADGRLVLSGDVDLAVEAMEEDRVVESRSLRPADVGAGEATTVAALGQAEWTFEIPVRTLSARLGAHRLLLRIGDREWRSRTFRIGETLDAPASITLRYAPSKARYALGEAIPVRFVMSNEGKETFCFDEGGDYRGAGRHLRWLFRAVSAEGVAAVDPAPDPVCFGGLGMADPALAPGETYEEDLSLLAYLRFPEPGRYTVEAYQTLGFGEPVAGLECGGFTDFAAGGKFDIEIVRPGAEERRGILALALSIEDHDERLSRFSTLYDPAYLDELAALVAGEPDDARIEAALTGIGSIMTVPATERLMDLAADPRARVRMEALRRLSWRLPDPRDTGRARPDGPFRLYSSEARRRDVATGWDERLREPFARLLVRGLRAADPDEVSVCGYCLGALGETGTAELLAAAADRIAPSLPIPEAAARCVDQLASAACVLAQLGDRPVAARVGCSPGRLAVWANMVRTKPEYRAAGWQDLILHMLDADSSTLRMAAIRWLPEDFGRRAEIPWRKLFLDPDRQVWWHAIQVARQHPPEGLVTVVEACLPSATGSDREGDLRQLLEEIRKR
jgi:hypothetical protein